MSIWGGAVMAFSNPERVECGKIRKYSILSGLEGLL